MHFRYISTALQGYFRPSHSESVDPLEWQTAVEPAESRPIWQACQADDLTLPGTRVGLQMQRLYVWVQYVD
jgi:hypothetical protein